MNVKCIDTGEKLDRNIAYKIVVNGKNKYFSSEEGYIKFENNKKYRGKVIDLIRECMGYSKPQMKLPTLTYKKISEYKEFGYDVLYDTLLINKQDIEWSFQNKDFKSEIAKITYLFAILENHFMEVYRNKLAEIKMLSQHVPSELEDISEIESIERKQPVKDLRGFLNED